MTDLAGRRVLVCGLGVSGTAAVRVLTTLGARVTGHDERAGDPPPDLDATDLVVVSPGWRPDHPLLASAAERGIDVWGEAELAWRLNPEPTRWLAVTGTNGKTTTTEMLAAMLAAAGVRSAAAGNIGRALVDAVGEQPPFTALAVELSSFQLHWAPSVRPTVGALLNLADDHLDWHGDRARYAEAKVRVWAGNEVSVANADDPAVVALVPRAASRVVGFTLRPPAETELGVVAGTLVDRAFGSGPLLDVAELQVRGPHNVANALAASALALAGGVPADAVATTLRGFTTGAHRNVVVRTLDGVRYVDDSKATNPHAAAASLSAYESVVWVAGGLNKGLPFDDLVRDHAARLRAAVLIGTCADELGAALARHAPSVPVERAESLQTAVETARGLAHAGDVVLLAPAAASMDMFTDYAARGAAFAAAVNGLEGT
jgi:UDP-N-acetylmuramoylalanine--D-glutamate ligase